MHVSTKVGISAADENAGNYSHARYNKSKSAHHDIGWRENLDHVAIFVNIEKNYSLIKDIALTIL